MRPRASVSPAAEADLVDIHRYIARNSAEHADRYLRRINDRIALIAEQPGIGSLRLPALPDVRTFPVGSHLLFYRVLPDGGVELVRVLHGARDWQGLSEDELG